MTDFPLIQTAKNPTAVYLNKKAENQINNDYDNDMLMYKHYKKDTSFEYFYENLSMDIGFKTNEFSLWNIFQRNGRENIVNLTKYYNEKNRNIPIEKVIFGVGPNKMDRNPVLLILPLNK